MKRIVLLLALVLLFSGAKAEELKKQSSYTFAAGIRMGVPFGVTGKFFVNDKLNYEGILSSGWGGVSITGLLQISNPTSLDPNLKWFYGGGAHVAIGVVDQKTPFFGTGTNGVLGIDGIVGLCYEVPDYPVEFSIDWMPSLNLIGEFGYGNHFFSISARYLF